MTTLEQRNRRSAGFAALVALAMVALGYASVPLYRMFCQATGLGGTTQRATEAELPAPVAGSAMSIRFDANVSPKLPWRFRPEHDTDTVTVGAKDMAIFIARNMSDKPVTGTASYNVVPEQAGKYFKKIQCFCFTQQTLQPGEQVRMPVIYFVDPKILTDPDANDIEQITLSYTFYPVDSPKKGS